MPSAWSESRTSQTPCYVDAGRPDWLHFWADAGGAGAIMGDDPRTRRARATDGSERVASSASVNPDRACGWRACSLPRRRRVTVAPSARVIMKRAFR